MIYRNLLFILCTVALVRRETEGRISSNKLSFFSRPKSSSAEWSLLDEDSSDTIFEWVEEISDTAEINRGDAIQSKSKSNRRRFFWSGSMEDESYDPQRCARKRKSETPTVPPHLLRMQEWNFTFAWKEQCNERDAHLNFEFDPNGYVRCLHPNRSCRQKNQQSTAASSNSDKENSYRGRHRRQNYQFNHSESDDDTQYIVGTWKLSPSGVVWSMSWDGHMYSFFADLQLAPFGPNPKMYRGLVIRDRSILPKRFMRPIVATFTGMGVGTDTTDFSYKGRGPPKQ